MMIATMTKFYVNLSAYSGDDYLNIYVTIYAENRATAMKAAELMYPKLTACFADEEEPSQ